MAPITTPQVVLIFPWPIFQAYLDLMPLIGGRLHTMAPSTTTPKASFADPFYTVPNSNPVLLDDTGKATVYLQGNYDLRLEDEDGVLLWAVSNFTFSSGVPDVPTPINWTSQETTVTASPGQAVLTVSNAAPAGMRVIGVQTRVQTAFGTSQGLTGIAVGDATVMDRWGLLDLTEGSTTIQQDFHDSTEHITPVSYTVLLSALSGLFDATGSIKVVTYFSALDAVTP